MNPLHSVTTTNVTLTVTPDTTAPRFLYATCGATLSDFAAVLSEPLDDNCGMSGSVSDGFSWNIRNIADRNDTLGVAGATYAEGDTMVRFTSALPRDPNKAYEIVVAGFDLHDTAAARTSLPMGSSVILSCASNELVSLDATWKFLDDDTLDPGPNWFLPGFDDSGWKSGRGPFDAKGAGGGAAGANCRDVTLYGLGSVGTCINLLSTLTPTNRLTNADFRARFSFNGDPSTAILQINGKFDDSAQIYLNGSELLRFSLPAGPVVINRTTYGANYVPAGRTVNDTDAQDTAQLQPPSTLVRGTNVIAVRLVQVNATSSDLTMGLHLYAVTPPVPRLSISRNAGMVTLRWDPAIGTLRATTNLTAPKPWPAVTGSPASPFTTSASGRFQAFSVTVP